jgi:hypothetical protein
MPEEQQSYNAGDAEGKAGDCSPAPWNLRQGEESGKRQYGCCDSNNDFRHVDLYLDRYLGISHDFASLWLNPERSEPVHFGPSRGRPDVLHIGSVAADVFTCDGTNTYGASSLNY